MKTIWTECQDEISSLTCDFCCETLELKRFNGGVWCQSCLENEEYEEEPSYNQQCDERNK